MARSTPTALQTASRLNSGDRLSGRCGSHRAPCNLPYDRPWSVDLDFMGLAFQFW
ncbi:MAG: hypothetical protein WBG32_01265 [Nodosilinea sp.]